jgi:hypothetical protein
MSGPATITPNAPAAGAVSGTVYAFSSGATDGFVMERQFDDIALRPADVIPTFNVVNAVQISVAASVFNTQLGAYDTVTDTFANDTVTFDSAAFKTALATTADVISVGALSTMYSDFKAYVGTYFGFNGGFETLFAAATEFTIDSDDKFEADSLIALVNGTATVDTTHPYTKVMTGSITISNVNKLLRFAVDSNCFGNRTPSGDTSAATGNYGVDDKFLADDLIWVPKGIKVTLKLAIAAEAYTPINNRGPTYVSQVTDTNTTNFKTTTSADTALITRIVEVPLLIRLK